MMIGISVHPLYNFRATLAKRALANDDVKVSFANLFNDLHQMFVLCRIVLKLVIAP